MGIVTYARTMYDKEQDGINMERKHLEYSYKMLSQMQAAAVRPSSMKANPEDQHATSQQIQQVQKLLSQMCVGNSNIITGESQTALGDAVLNMTQRTVLFRVDDRHRAMSRQWRNRAEGEGGETKRQWDTVLEGKVPLAKEELQSAMTAMLSFSPDQRTFTFQDTHSTPSVCGPWRPSYVGCTSGALLPVNTTFILEVKAQTSKATSYYTPAHVQQRAPDGGWSYVVDDARDTDVLSALCAVLSTPVAELGARPLPNLELVDSPGRTLDTCGWLGCGATAEVFKVMQPGFSGDTAAAQLSLATQQGPLQQGLSSAGVKCVDSHKGQHSQAPVGRHAAAKVLRSLEPAALDMLAQEATILLKLHEESERLPGSFLAVPRCLGQLQGRRGDQPIRGLLLQPVGVVLSHKTLQEVQGTGLAAAIQGVVDALRLSHSLGTVHCDVRPDNLLVAPGSPSAGPTQPCLYLSDWGCSRSFGVTLPAAQYCGTTKFASDNVLQALSVGAPVSVKPEDDLESLVKSCFFLRRGDAEATALCTIDKQRYADLLQLWRAQLLGRPMWASIIAKARLKDYDGVSQALVGMLE